MTATPNHHPKGKLLIFCAPSGAGKTTIVRHLLRHFAQKLSFSISATTRAPRHNEKEGKDYYFMSTEQFAQKIAAGEFVEYEQVYQGLYYGTLHQELERIWQEGRHVVFDIDIKGASTLKHIFGDRALTVFIQPPSFEALTERLKSRKTDSKKTIEERLEKAKEEMQAATDFDYKLINDDLDTCLKEAEDLTRNFLEAQQPAT